MLLARASYGPKLEEVLLRANAVRPGVKGARKLGRTHHRARSISNSHLHIALALAITVSSAIAIVIPIARTTANEDDGARSLAVMQGGDALSEALRAQAGTVAGALASVQAGGQSTTALNLPRPLGSGLIPEPLLAEAARLAANVTYPTPGTQAALVMTRPYGVPFTVHEDGFTSTYKSAHVTVGQALASQGIRIGEADSVSPPPGSELSPGAHIYVHHAVGVRLVLAGNEQTVRTRAQTVGDVLAQAGIVVEAKDRVTPRLGKPVTANMTIKMTTVRDVVGVTEEPIEYESLIQYDAELARGVRLLAEGGEYGWVRREYQLRQVNGRETRRVLVSETVTPPKDEVVTIGTYVAPALAGGAAVAPTPAVAGAVATPQGDAGCARTLNVYATWYTASSAGGSGVTATGTSVHKGIVAVDPGVIPLGTRMYIPGYGYGVAGDTGGGIVGNHIDLGYGPNDVKDWRTRWVDICIL
jgi:3D (Asp-Asp-Asp) domain-containing protein